MGSTSKTHANAAAFTPPHLHSRPAPSSHSAHSSHPCLASRCLPPHPSSSVLSYPQPPDGSLPQTLLIPHRIDSSTPPSALQVPRDQGPTCSQYYWSSFCPSNRPMSFFPRGFAHAILSAENTCHPFYAQFLVRVLAQIPRHQRSPLWPLQLKKNYLSGSF